MNIEHSNLLIAFCLAALCLFGCGDDEPETAGDAAPMATADMGPTGGMDAPMGGMDAPMDPDEGVAQEPDAGPQPLNGCIDSSAADDRTGDDNIEIPWGDNHGDVRCTRIGVGATVVFGPADFSGHNLNGGPYGERDADSPITMARADFDARTKTVIFEAAGVFPYYCLGHPGDHMGVIYVE